MAQRQYYHINFRKSEQKRCFFVFKFLGFCFLFFIFSLLFLFIYYAKDLPRPEKFTEKEFIQSTKIYDREGKVLLYEIYDEEKRTVVSLKDLPEHLKQAVIVTEDINFYNHFGLDLKAILRAAIINLKIGKPVHGGSTISQQLVRSTFLGREKTIERKIKEIVLTLELERRYSKDQILEWYLNQVPFGPNIYGVEAASRAFFQKPSSEITLAESAILASLIRAPSYLSPYGENLDKLLARKNYVLDRMIKFNFIDEEEGKRAKEEEIKFAKIHQKILAPHFVMYIKEQLEEKYGNDFLKKGGLKVYTTLDWELQKLAEKVISVGAEKNKKFHAYNVSLVAICPKTGQILVMVGSKDFFGKIYPKDCLPGKNCLFEPYPNVSLLGRQPGSAFKPFAYATAFKKGFSDKYIVIDEETNFGIWGGEPYIPQNYDGKFRGEITLREALAQSLNIPSIKVLMDLAGIEDTLKTAREMGITTLTKPSSFYGPALVLGSGEVKLLEMVSAYSVFATEGLRIPPVSILKIEDSFGKIIDKPNFTPKRVLERKVARLINDILSDNQARAPIFGLRSPLYFENFQVAVKTGTTDNFRDGWIIGYTPSLVVGVWVGNNNNLPMKKEPGVVLAGPIWNTFMQKTLFKFPKENFNPPDL